MIWGREETEYKLWYPLSFYCECTAKVGGTKRVN